MRSLIGLCNVRQQQPNTGLSAFYPRVCRDLITLSVCNDFADFRNGLILPSVNTDYLVRGNCATSDFRGDSNGRTANLVLDINSQSVLLERPR